MKSIAILQPMFLPWYGVFDLMRLANIFVFLDDVQFPQGRSFCSRVQIKTKEGIAWLTVPVKRKGGQLINAVRIDNEQDWMRKHVAILNEAYRRAPCWNIASTAIEKSFANRQEYLCDFNTDATRALASMIGIECELVISSQIGVTEKGSNKILEIVRKLGGDIYLTGHGGRNYLDHVAFERNGIEVRYMNYQLAPYRQGGDEFTPYVSILDGLAHLGPAILDHFGSTTVNWRQFVEG